MKTPVKIAVILPHANLLYRHHALKPPRTLLDRWRYNARDALRLRLEHFPAEWLHSAIKKMR